MAKLSEQLAELSVRAKQTEDSFAEAKREEHDKLEARQAKAHAAATAAVARVDQEVKSFDSSVSQDWSAVRAKVSADMMALKNRVDTARHDLDVKRAKQRADQLEQDAAFAIDYAIASVEQAKLAVIDAVQGRAEAEMAARS